MKSYAESYPESYTCRRPLTLYGEEHEVPLHLGAWVIVGDTGQDLRISLRKTTTYYYRPDWEEVAAR
jgi:hypothetical protein